jgi:hypothetical protein
MALMSTPLIGLALILGVGLAAPASAQTAAADAQSPPTPDAGTTAQTNCIAESDGYQGSGKAVTYMIELENKCAKRLRCEVFAYIVQAKGPSRGHAIMILGANSQGAAAKRSYAVKVKLVGGLAQTARECRVF